MPRITRLSTADAAPMPLTTKLVGQEVGRISALCDTRWLMAYAAGVPDQSPELFDTTSALVVHPMFPVAPEWALLAGHQQLDSMMSRDELLRGVHAAHDVIHERPITAGETITITARIVGVGRRPLGATQHTLFQATDASGANVWRTSFRTLFRGVALDGDPIELDIGWPELPARVNGKGSSSPVAAASTEVRSLDAHVYAECARIWNPIHTDLAVARASGLEAPILHGTATMARATSIVAQLTSIRIADVTRVAGTFRSMVLLGSTITIRVLETHARSVSFDVVNGSGKQCIADGIIATSVGREGHVA